MNQDQAYQELLDHVKQTTALSQVAGILEWDQEVMMPAKGTVARAEQRAALEAVAHEKRIDPRFEEWLGVLDGVQLEPVAAANFSLARRQFYRSSKIPSALAVELAHKTSSAQRMWAKARANNNFKEFSGVLAQIVELRQQEADCIAEDGQSRYDALLNDYEPGMTVEVLEPLLENMRPRLSALRQRIAESGKIQPKLEGKFDTDLQLALARELGDVVGYDWQSGRLDLSVHPFSSGTGGDVRITTRVDSAEPLGCLYSTLHELGHALYEQGLPSEWALTPVGQHVSMGVHESQSRLWENQIGRSRAFCAWFYPRFKAVLGSGGLNNEDEFYRAVNRVETGFIRTEADEVHYNLHVLLRFELERDLISGALRVEDLEAEWNHRFERDFGLKVPCAADGVLQDVHWSVGLFGYFPTYSLGNIYAGQIKHKLNHELDDMDSWISNGKTGAILDWLRENIHQKGSLLAPDGLIESVVSAPVSADPLLDYLEQKYTELLEL